MRLRGIWAALLGLVLALAAPAEASAQGGEAPGAPGASANWTTGNKQGLGTSVGTDSKVWEHVRRPRERGHRPAGAVGRFARAGLRAGQHGPVRPLPDQQDLRHRPAALDRPAAGPVHGAAARRVPDVRPLRPGARQLLARRHRVADRAGGGRGAAHQRRRHARGPGGLVRVPAHVQRLRRHQRRVDRPRGQPAARLRLRHRDRRERPADRRAARRLPGGKQHDPHARAGVRRLGRGGRADGAGQRRGRVRRPCGRLRRRVAQLPLLPLRPAAHPVHRRGDDGEGARGQDVPGCVHRVADAAVGLRGQRRLRRGRLPLRVGP